MIEGNAGWYSWYPSAMCSRYYGWMCELGYPTLDVRQFEDGEWAILQYHTIPLIPSMTKWHWVLQGIKNTEITPAFIEKFVDMIDITKRSFWAREDEKTKAVELEHAATDRHAEDMVNRAHDVCMRSPALLDRIAKFGIEELDLLKIAKHIPYYQW